MYRVIGLKSLEGGFCGSDFRMWGLNRGNVGKLDKKKD